MVDKLVMFCHCQKQLIVIQAQSNELECLKKCVRVYKEYIISLSDHSNVSVYGLPWVWRMPTWFVLVFRLRESSDKIQKHVTVL